MRISLLAAVAAVALSTSASAQSSSSSNTHKTPVGSVTHSTSTSSIGNGSYTTNTVSPANKARVKPYVGTSTTDLYPNKTPSTTVPHAGVVIPLGREQ